MVVGVESSIRQSTVELGQLKVGWSRERELMAVLLGMAEEALSR